jgi:ABC-type transport system involved in multi-copper enzyme maturation permease subunit
MKILSITAVGIKECLRHRILYGIFLMAVIFILMGKGCNPGTLRGDNLFFDRATRETIAMTVAFHGIVFWSLLLCGLVAAAVLSKELEDGTALLTLSRPIRHAAFIAGKLCSAVIVSVLNLLVLGGLFSLFFYTDAGRSSISIFTGLLWMTASLVLYTLMTCCFSMLLPRVLAPLVSILVYGTACWAALPHYFEKLRIVWTPSGTVTGIYKLFPCFGDLQFIGAALIHGTPSWEHLTGTVVNVFLYCAGFWLLILFTFARRQA